jgi:hypothetical protein
MKVYTSNYWKYRGGCGVQISNSKPANANPYKTVWELFPYWDRVRDWNEVKKLPKDNTTRQWVWNSFVEAYRYKLNNLGIEKVKSLLQDGDVLLCWCHDANECHRSILAEWLREHGVEVEEI